MSITSKIKINLTFAETTYYNMLKGFFNVPIPVNEPILGYAPGSKER